MSIDAEFWLLFGDRTLQDLEHTGQKSPCAGRPLAFGKLCVYEQIVLFTTGMQLSWKQRQDDNLLCSPVVIRGG